MDNNVQNLNNNNYQNYNGYQNFGGYQNYCGYPNYGNYPIFYGYQKDNSELEHTIRQEFIEEAQNVQLTSNRKSKKKTKKIALAIAGLVALIGLGVGGAAYYRYATHTDQLVTEITKELGDTYLDEEITYYVDGSDKALENATVDISQVDCTTVGDYTIVCETKKKTYEVVVHVVDTTKPELNVTPEKFTCSTGREYDTDVFVDSVSDYTNDVTTVIEYGGQELDVISFDTPGSYSFSVIARDPSGNETTEELTFEFVNPPEFILVNDISLAVGTEYDPLLYAFAWDEIDGNMQDDIQVDIGDLDTNVYGEYEVVYSVTNSYGITEEKPITVTVGDVTDYNLDYTSEEFSILKEFGYFQYEVLEEGNFDEVMQLIEPTLLDIYTDAVAGSAVIYEITEDTIYVVTAKHCFDHMKSMTVMFFDGTVTTEMVPTTYINENGYELVMGAFPTSAVPKEVLFKLKEIHVEYNIYDSTPEGTEVLIYAKNWKWGKRDISSVGKILSFHHELSEYNLPGEFIYTDFYSCPGMSGTAIVDSHGNLLGVLYGSWPDGIRIITTINDMEKLDQRKTELVQW